MLTASKVDRYDIDDIDVLRTFHSVYRSTMVASQSNNTDPDGKTKIMSPKSESSYHTDE